MKNLLLKHSQYKKILMIMVFGCLLSTSAIAQNFLREIKQVASDGVVDANLGYSVSVSGNYAIVGSPANASSNGSAYIYSFNGSTWTESQKLTNPGVVDGFFGNTVSISGNYAIVGAHLDAGNVAASGAAYIYSFNGTTWVAQQKIVANDGATQDYFGYSVNMQGNSVIVGAKFDNDNGFNSGSAYVFTQNGDVWTQQAKIIASDGASNDYFGESISISGVNAIIGAYGDTDNGAFSGSAYIYSFNGANWTGEQKIKASDAMVDDYFGSRVSICGNNAIVGAYKDDAAVGSAYIFTPNGSTWMQKTKLTASNAAANDNFGSSVSIDGNIALVGAYNNNSNGAAYIYSFNGTNWNEKQILTASDGASLDLLGASVSLDGDKAIVGAYFDDDKGNNSGSVYFYNSDTPPTVITTTVSAIDTKFATSGGSSTIVFGGANVTQNGVCWSTNPIPNITSDSFTNDIVSSESTFTSSITGLAQATTYYYAAYAINSIGTGYGSIMSFNTLDGTSALASIEATPMTVTENDAANAITSTIVITDIDDTNLEAATVSISGNYQSDEDVLAFTDQDGITGVWTKATGTLTLTGGTAGNVSLVLYQKALRSITYENINGDNPNTVARTISFTVNDGDNTCPFISRDISVTAVNDAPVLASIGADIDYMEKNPATAITSTITLNDIDDVNIEGATIEIASNYQSNEDILAFVNQNGITGTWSQSTGIMTLTGSTTVAVYQAALQSVTYVNSVTDNPNNFVRILSVNITDGDVSSNIVSKIINVSDFNDPAVLASVGGDFSFSESDAPKVITSTITVTDIDSPLLTSATVEISGNYNSAEDVLAFPVQPGYTGTWVAETGMLTIIGSSFTTASCASALHSVTYENTNLTNPSEMPRTISIKAIDGASVSIPAIRTINVIDINDAPMVAGFAKSGIEDNILSFNVTDFTSQFSDVEMDALSMVSFTMPASTVGTLNVNNTAIVGNTVAMVDLSNLTYVPAANLNGLVVLDWNASDGTDYAAAGAQISITLDPVSDAPTSIDTDGNVMSEDIAKPFIADDFKFMDIDGDVLSSIEVSAPTIGVLKLDGTAIISSVGFVQIPVNDISKLTYESLLNEHGLGYATFKYKVIDSQGTYSVNIYSFTLDVTPVYDPAVAVGDNYSVNEDAVLTKTTIEGLTINDENIDMLPLTVNLASNVQNGELTVFRNGSFSYNSNENFNGYDSFSYFLFDGTGNSNTVTIDITVNAVNDAPMAKPEAYETTEDIALVVTTGGVLDNDSDIDGDVLKPMVTQQPANGTLSITMDGLFSYTPNDNFYGEDKFLYQAGDVSVTSATVTVTINVLAVNDVPAMPTEAKSFTVAEDQLLNVNAVSGLLLGVRDVENDPLTAKLVSDATNGMLTISEDGSFTYLPNADYNGADSFEFKVFDGISFSSTASVDISVTAVNDAPVAISETFEVDEDVILNGSLLGNDTDTEGNTLTAMEVTKPMSGTLSITMDGMFTYTPNADFNGNDSFTYKANDGKNDSEAVEVSITVLPVNDAPVLVSAPNKLAVYMAQRPITGFEFSDVDIMKDEKVQVTLTAQSGVIEVTDYMSELISTFGNGTNKVILKGTIENINNAINSEAWYPLVYVGNNDFVGIETFNIVFSDLGNTGKGAELTATGTTLIDVTPIPPVITKQPVSATVCAGATVELSIEANGTSTRTYQWQLDGTDITGETTDKLLLENLTDAVDAEYKCIVTDYNLTDESDIALINVGSVALSITYDGDVCADMTTVVAKGTSPYGSLLYTLKGLFDKRFNQLNGTFADVYEGSYAVTVKDAIGCSAMEEIMIAKPLSVELEAQSPVCNGGNASIVPVVSGGAASYSFVWSNGDVTSVLENIPADTYSIIVSDANGCTAANSVEINEPAPIIINIARLRDERNAGTESGLIEAKAIDGDAPYQYFLNESTVSMDDGIFDNLNFGDYTVKVMDAIGCIAEKLVTVNTLYKKPEIVVDMIVDNLTVNVVNNTVVADSYTWNFGDGSAEVSDEAPTHTYASYGSYIVTITSTNTYGTSTITKQVKLDPYSSISETVESALNVSVYPNPTEGIFTLSYSSDKTIGDLTVKVISVTGQVLSIDKFNVSAIDMSKSFDMSGMAKGIYLIETTSNRSVSTQQIIIK